MVRDYEALTRFLQGRPEPEVILRFDELDRIIDGLPASARRYQAWWANSRISQPQARGWLDAGRRATVDLNQGIVRFTYGAETVHTPRIGWSAGRSGQAPSLRDTGEIHEVTVRLEWLDAGSVSLSASAAVVFPPLPNAPGLYRFRFSGSGGGHPTAVYIGETVDLARRMASYRHPGPTQATNIRINAAMIDTLRAGGAVTVGVVRDLRLDGQVLDLRSRATRRLAENLALTLAADDGAVILNL